MKARQELAEALDLHLTERRRIGRSLHDEIGPTLSAVGFHLEALRLDHPELAVRTAEIQESLENAMQRLRALSQELSPSMVERAGFRFALDYLIDSQRSKFPGRIALVWECAAAVPRPVAMALYDIAELALDNAVTHSGAAEVTVTVSGSRRISIAIEDNGQGFETSVSPPHGLGLLKMQAAARRIGATFLVDSVAGRSTIVKANYAIPSSPRR